MDLFCLKRSGEVAGGKFITNISHPRAGYSNGRATLFLKVTNEKTRGNCKDATREILIRCWQKNSTKMVKYRNKKPCVNVESPLLEIIKTLM